MARREIETRDRRPLRFITEYEFACPETGNWRSDRRIRNPYTHTYWRPVVFSVIRNEFRRNDERFVVHRTGGPPQGEDSIFARWSANQGAVDVRHHLEPERNDKRRVARA